MALTEEERKKLYVDHNYMERLISEQINFAPLLDTLTWKNKSAVNERRVNRMKKVLSINKWEQELNWMVYDNQIATGDQFFEIYFVKDDPVPRLRNLKSKKMTDIVTDDYGRVLAYIYKDTIVNETVNYATSTAFVDRTSSRTVTWVFEKGRTTILDPLNIMETEDGEVIYELDEKNNPIVDAKGKKVPKIKPIVKNNKPSLRDEFMLLHIPSLKREDEEFSEIIATRILDNCLKMAQITSDFRYTNRIAGFPVNAIIDGTLIKELSSRSPGGFLIIESDNLQDGQAKLQTIQIDNDLKSLENEMDKTEVDLYRKFYLFRPDVEIEASKSDSSLVQQQLRLSLEKWLEQLVININTAMVNLFNIAQKSYGYERIYEFKFKIPEPIIETSKQQKLLQEIQEVNAGFKSLQKIWEDRGYTPQEIEKLKQEINDEIYLGNDDIRINKQVPKLDNNFK